MVKRADAVERSDRRILRAQRKCEDKLENTVAVKKRRCDMGGEKLEDGIAIAHYIKKKKRRPESPYIYIAILQARIFRLQCRDYANPCGFPV